MSETSESNTPQPLTKNAHGHEAVIEKQMATGKTEQEARDIVAERLKDPITRELVREGRRNTAEQEQLATTDSLTGLYNKRWLNDELPRLIAASQRDGSPLSTLLIDLDKFKAINDTLGHAEGDRVLIEVANMMKTVFSRPGDRIARTGGDEFVVVLENTPVRKIDEDGKITGGALPLAEELIANLNVHQWGFAEGTDPDLVPGCSVGIAQHRTETAEDLLHEADDAMYVAKQAGRGRAEVWTPQAPIEHNPDSKL